MISVINPETSETLLLTEDDYREMVKKYAAWQRALENAADVPEELGAVPS